MTLTLLPAPAPRPGALLAPQFDPRPCVTNDPRMWDLGNDGNDLAIKLCAGCPANNPDDCEPGPGVIRHGIPYSDTLRRIKVCRDCDYPVTRIGDEGLPKCRCAGKYRPTEDLVNEWLSRGGPDRGIARVAVEMGVARTALKDALHRARTAGDTRIPLFASNRRRVAA